MIDQLREQGIRDEKVLSPRSPPYRATCSSRSAGVAPTGHQPPLGFSQTISQPFIVARMIEVLREGRELGKTLEVGAGCGYQAAVLAQLTDEVYAVERIEPLLAKPRRTCARSSSSRCV